MSLLPTIGESTITELEEGSNNRMNASLFCNVIQVNGRRNWFPWGKPYNSTYYEIIYTYRVLKKPSFPFLGRTVRIPNRMIAQLLVTLNCAAKALDIHTHNEETKSLPALVDYEETNQLSNIDGYAATTGIKTRIVLRTGLLPEEKERAITQLLRKTQSKNEPAVYLWKSNE